MCNMQFLVLFSKKGKLGEKIYILLPWVGLPKLDWFTATFISEYERILFQVSLGTLEWHLNNLSG